MNNNPILMVAPIILSLVALLIAAIQMKKKTSGVLVAELVICIVLTPASLFLNVNPLGSAVLAVTTLILLVMLMIHRKGHKAERKDNSTRLSFGEVASILNQAISEEFGEESVYLSMKEKAKTGSAHDTLAFAKRLKQDNCGRPKPEGLTATVAYFREIVDALESVSFLSEAKLELAYTYLGLADVFQKTSDMVGFEKYADMGLDYFRRALATGEFEDHREDYEIIQKNIQELRAKS